MGTPIVKTYNKRINNYDATSTDSSRIIVKDALRINNWDSIWFSEKAHTIEIDTHEVEFKAFFDIEKVETSDFPFDESLQHEIIVKLPPKKRYIIKMKVENVKKAKPKIILPEELI